MQDKSTEREDKAGSGSAPQEAPPAPSSAKLAEKQRLAEALRANLRRRKEQTRQRRTGANDDAGSRDS
ncbi:hypothetical protein K9U39_01645 [Rhodoblastus acidophilus]|uniref:Uncharacterized protein n=1 Tax=Candidatus Rhodoblastus alkanivorans TaxID=2954117 RepID=A0ABS9Z593_9HYPH|nr:hypothetical protein [Candidatus Rhodoblastus alkanivorans]MCI4679969.1 hypothetical protein [Candidatus Rhodoblastus alkanivorans]MCI4682352.1 hypothetical protein [Candidatus Rhodoblastus alkanivorans]MDI4639655.1 hypothetical protein [Rhodoblastus acidophilus]